MEPRRCECQVCASDAPVMQRWRYDEPSMNRPPSIKRLFPCHDLYSGWLMVACARSRLRDVECSGNHEMGLSRGTETAYFALPLR